MEVDLGDMIVGEGHPCGVVAEIGNNHQGSMERALALLDVAKEAGCAAAKIQKRTLEVAFTRAQLAASRPSPWGLTYGEYRRAVELSREQLAALAGHARVIGLGLTSSCWDAAALEDVMATLHPRWLKIASACVTDLELLRLHRSTGLPLVLSTGMSTVEEIDRAVETLGTERLVLLHCCSAYPAEKDDLNLRAIASLRKRYGVPVGYSGHERGLTTSIMAAVAFGACLIERHVTLDRTLFGTDHAASLEPAGLRRLVRDLRGCEEAAGSPEIRRLPSEEGARAKLRRVG